MKTKVKSLWQRIKTPPELSTKVSVLLTVGLLLAAAVGLTALCLMIGTLDLSRGRFSSYFHEPTILFLNFLPVLLLVALIYFATNRAWLAFTLPTPVLIIMSFVNYYKVILRGDPFIAEDFSAAGEGAGILGHYTISLPWILYVAIAFWIIGSLVLLRYARARVDKKIWWVRVIAVVLCILIGALSWCTWYSNDELYNKQKNYSLFNEWKNAENYASHGFIYAFLHSIEDAIVTPPEGYSEDKAKEILGAYEDAQIPQEKKVNVVATMLESFSDLSVFDQINFTADPYSDYHKLLSECYHGTLIVDSIGGATINAERAFLTGFTYPQPRYATTTNSFVHYIRQQGYQTDGSHPGHDWFYSRNNVTKRLGFDRYLFMEGHYESLTDTEYAYDNVLFPELARIYDEETADGEPYFSFTVSYQNHSPYNSLSLDGAEYVSHEGISDETYYLFNNYLNSVADTGKRVAEYVDTFRDNEEPVVLLFFGDHKPTFGAGNRCYQEMGISTAERSAEGCAALYSTPYFIWANDAALALLQPELSAPGRTISPAFLMAELFDFLGWDGPAWMQYQRDVRETISVMHCDRMFMVDGILTDTLSEQAQAVYDEFKIVQYYERTTLHSSKK